MFTDSFSLIKKCVFRLWWKRLKQHIWQEYVNVKLWIHICMHALENLLFFSRIWRVLKFNFMYSFKTYSFKYFIYCILHTQYTHHKQHTQDAHTLHNTLHTQSWLNTFNVVTLVFFYDFRRGWRPRYMERQERPPSPRPAKPRHTEFHTGKLK